MDDRLSRWEEIVHLGAGQWGHVARAQLRVLGVPAATIDTWVSRGRLYLVHSGVYAVGYRRIEPEAIAMAAVLTGHPLAVLSHDSAAALWGLRRWPDPPEIAAPGRIRHKAIRAHQTALTDSDITVQRGIPTTTAARTLRDIRPRIGNPKRFGRLVNQARLDHHLDSAVAAALLGHTRNATRSGGEDTFWRFCRTHHLPEPELNTTVCGHEVDARFPEHGVIVEIDHYATHGDPATWNEDRIRDSDLQAAGYLVVRITEQRLTDDAKAEAARLRAILNRRRVRPREGG